jgi:hypothetical protein
MDKNGKKVVRIVAIIFISFVLFALYMSRPIFGIPIFDFEKYKYELIERDPKGELYLFYDKKTKNISISIENIENWDIFIIGGEVYENNILKEKFSINKNLKEIRKEYSSYAKSWHYQIHKLPKIKVNSEFKIVIYYKDKNGEQHKLTTNYRYEKNPYFPYTMLYPDW